MIQNVVLALLATVVLAIGLPAIIVADAVLSRAYRVVVTKNTA